jgi:ABC-type phosphate transport system substrate-binding protein
MRALLLILGISWSLAADAGGLLVIASKDVPDDSVSIEQLAKIYSMKKTFWKNGIQIVPVNHEASSEERARFSEAVFNLSPQELLEYTDKLRFQGKAPPIVQSSDQAVISFVRKVPGAIGYIEGEIAPSGTKVLTRLP